MKRQNKLFLVTNMYPSINNRQFGSFVESIYENLKEDKWLNVELIGLTYSNTKFIKYIKYLFFYSKIIIKLLFYRYSTFYFHFVSHSALPLLFFKQRVVVLNFHGNDLKESGFLKFLVRHALETAKLVIVPTVDFKKRLGDFYNHSNIIVSPSSGIPDNFFCRRIYSSSPNAKIGYVGRTILNKGIDIVIDFFETMRKEDEQVSLQVVGGIISVEEYRKFHTDASHYHEVSFTPSVSRECLFEYYRNIDIFLFPSRFRESLGLVVLEAMANMCVVIMSPQESFKEILSGNEAVFFVDENDLHSFRNVYRSIMSMSSEEIQEKLNNSYTTAFNFRNSKVKTDLISAIKNL